MRFGISLMTLALAALPVAVLAQPGNAHDAASRAYAASARGEHVQALLDAREAVRLDPSRLDWRHLLVHELIATGDDAQAQAELDALEQRGGPSVAAGVAELRRMLGQRRATAALKLGEQAYRAFATHDYASAADKAGQASQLDPDRQAYRLLRLRALAAGGQPALAIEEAGRVLQANPGAAEVRALRSRLRHGQGELAGASSDARQALESAALPLPGQIELLQQEGRPEEARERFVRAMAEAGMDTSADPDLAYLAVRVDEDATALAIFHRAHAQGRLPATSLQDAAYTASRLAENGQALGYFKEAIDAADAGHLPLTVRRHFETRREVSDRDRTWGFHALLGYRGIAPGMAVSSPPLYGDVAQLLGEAYWRPQGYRDGSFWELYGGLAQTIYSRRGGATGAPTTQGALGVRAKPLRDHNLVLALERRIRIGSLSANDWLLRAGYSGGFGTDLRVDVPSWNTLHLYAEAGRFVRARQTYATFELQAGRSYRLGDAAARWVAFPHVVVGVDYNSRRSVAGYNGAAGAGVGIGLRRWFREDRHHAPRSYLDLSLQYRARLAGDERGRGVFLRAALIY